MMRLWVDSYSKATPVAAGATLSVVAHTVVIAAWVIATMPAANLPSDSFANRTYYVPPPDRTPGTRGSRETVRYVDLLKEGPGMGDGPRTIGDERPAAPIVDETVGRAAADTTTSPAVTPTPGPPDSVFSVLEVDTAVVRSASSAAPAYPLKLLEAHIMGSVSAQYIVDTTGFADTSSFHVMKSTNPEFITAVREALPYMRFTPAKIGNIKVRQLVEQQFSFKITDTVVAPPKRKP
jgi:protein TonB